MCIRDRAPDVERSQDPLRVPEIIALGSPGEREGVELLRPDRLWEAKLQLLEHRDRLRLAVELDQAVGGLAAERGGRVPGEPTRGKQLLKAVGIIVEDRSLDLVRLLPCQSVLLRTEARRLRGQRLSRDRVEKTQQLTAVGSIGIAAEVEKHAVLREPRKRRAVQLDRDELERLVFVGLALECLILPGDPAGIRACRRPDQDPGLTLGQSLLQLADELIAAGQPDLIEEHLEALQAEHIIQIEHPDPCLLYTSPSPRDS